MCMGGFAEIRLGRGFRGFWVVNATKKAGTNVPASDCIETLISAEPKLGFRLF